MLYDNIKTQRTLSLSGGELLKQLEGFKLKAYQDSKGKWTIGFGSTYISNRPVRKGDVITIEQANDQFNKDLIKFQDAINELVTVYLDQNQYDALVLLVYNIGINALRTSTILKLINQKRFDEASEQFERWIWSGGNKIEGLKNRRETERRLFNGELA